MTRSTAQKFAVLLLALGGLASLGAVATNLGIEGTAGTTDNAVVRADGTGGNVVQGSALAISDNGCLTATGATITASEPVLNATQTWNAAGTTFTGLKLNITDSASAAGSMLADLQAGSATRLKLVAGASRQSVLTLTSPSQTGALTFTGSDRSGTLQNSGNGNGLAMTGGFLDVQGTSSTVAGTVKLINDNNTTTYAVLSGTGCAWDRTKTLTESAATAFVQIAVASGAHVGGRIHYTIIANDGTDYQTRTGLVNFAAVNKAGTETVGLGTVVNEAVAASTGTLTATIDTDTSPTNAFTVRANAVSSLTQTTLTIRYWVEIDGAAVTVTPQ